MAPTSHTRNFCSEVPKYTMDCKHSDAKKSEQKRPPVKNTYRTATHYILGNSALRWIQFWRPVSDTEPQLPGIQVVKVMRLL
jgi:hypothetical protein